MSGSDLERILKIINAVKKHECLWNVNCSDYAKRDKLEKAWKDIAQEVGKSEVFCREKWRNVRTGFLRSIQHQIRRTSHDESAVVPNNFHAVKRKRFYLYDQMAFLLPSAETLEQTRKKRKLSKDKCMAETDDDVLNNDTDGDNSVLTTYNMVGKFETTEDNGEDSANEDEEVEHHTLLINGDVYTVNDNTDCNIDEILKEIEHNKNKRNIKLTKPIEKQELSLRHENDSVDKLSNVDLSACTNKKAIHMISEQINDNCLTKSNENLDSSKSPCEPIPDQQQYFNQRNEQQLLHFFRSCTDDVLSLNKRKQRLFKKRMLDLIEELHDS